MAAAFTHVYPHCSLEYQIVQSLPLPTEILWNIWGNFGWSTELHLGVLTKDEKALYDCMITDKLPADHRLSMMYELYHNSKNNALLS